MVAAQVSAQPNKAGGTSAVDAQMSVLEIGDECVLLDDVTCAICLSILHEPASLQCGHTFCSRCVQTALRRTAACPVCRQPASQVLAVNHLLSRLLTQTFPEETKARRVEIAQDAARRPRPRSSVRSRLCAMHADLPAASLRQLLGVVASLVLVAALLALYVADGSMTSQSLNLSSQDSWGGWPMRVGSGMFPPHDDEDDAFEPHVSDETDEASLVHTHGTIAIEEGTSLAPSTTLVYDDDIETPSRVTIDMSPAPARTGSLLTVDNVEQALTRAQAEVDRLRLRKEQLLRKANAAEAYRFAREHENEP